MKLLRKIGIALFTGLCLLVSLSACSEIDLREAFVQKTETQTRFLLNTEYVTILKEDTFALTVSAHGDDKAPDFDTVWSSDNPEIVTVNDGVLYAVSQGVTNVRAQVTVYDKTTYVTELICTVEVTINRVPITGLSLDKTSLSITEGDSAVLSAVLSPIQTTETAVVWSSSDSSVVSVGADGTVLANKAGKATITAVSASNDALSATCKVTVKESSSTQVKSITVSPDSLKLGIGEAAYLSASVSASSFRGSVIWQSDDTKVATVSQTGEVTGVAKGSTYITATAGNKSVSCRVTVSGGTGNVVPCTEVRLSQTDIRVVDGLTTIKLEAVCLPLNTTEIGVWSSGNTDVATVTTGGVVSIKNLSKSKTQQSTTIRYTVSGSVSASCTVTVTPESLLATEISMKKTQYTLAPEDTEQIVTNKTPASSADLWVWESSNSDVCTVTDTGKLCAVAQGTATVTVYSKDKPTVRASATVTVEPIQVSVKLATQSGQTTFTSYDDILLYLSTDDPDLLPSDATVALYCDNYRAVDFFVAPETRVTDILTVYPCASGTVVFTPQIITQSKRYRFVIEPLTITLSVAEPTSLSLTQSSLSLSVGEEKQLDYSVTPTECHGHIAVQYTVVDPSVLSVADDGTLVALAAGETTVTVSVVGKPTLTATCHVVVSER